MATSYIIGQLDLDNELKNFLNFVSNTCILTGKIVFLNGHKRLFYFQGN